MVDTTTENANDNANAHANAAASVTTPIEETTSAASTPSEHAASVAATQASTAATQASVAISTSTGSSVKKVQHLVVDSGAIIKGTNLAPLAEHFWTVPDVIKEVRDRRARAVLEALPFTLQTREPSAEAMKAIADFARKTGDFASLSLTDLRVMALTYMLESEQVGVEHLKTAPEAAGSITRDANGKVVGDDSVRNVRCKYFGTSMGCKFGDSCKFLHESVEKPVEGDDGEEAESSDDAEKTEEAGTELRKVLIACKFFNTPEGCKYGDSCHFLHEILPVNESATTDKEEDEAEIDAPIPDAIRNADTKSRILGGMGASSNAGAADDDGRGWINVGNFSKFEASPFGDAGSLATIEKVLPVGCITTDFSMQNVMLQMGLTLLSTDGMIIKRVKQWILKCIACFTTTTEMDRLFCPKCGNNTLERIAYSLDQNGRMVFHYRANRPVKLRGTKFSLPKPKGGRQGDLLLREDQLMVGIWSQRQRQHKKVVQSAFGEHVASDLGIKIEQTNKLVVGYGRMNPNAQRGRERRGKKKKSTSLF